VRLRAAVQGRVTYVHFTRDSHIVVIDDETVERTTGELPRQAHSVLEQRVLDRDLQTAGFPGTPRAMPTII
jgi:glycerophosphoryl diester phosphodiesterase